MMKPHNTHFNHHGIAWYVAMTGEQVTGVMHLFLIMNLLEPKIMAMKCYICNQIGHLARNYRCGCQEREATGNLNKNGTGADTRQVSTEESGTLSSVPSAERSKMSHSNLPLMGSVDPLSYLYSSDSEVRLTPSKSMMRGADNNM